MFTNVPSNETIESLANRAFTNNPGALNQQTDGVAMVSPLGPLRTYVYEYSIEENPEDMLMIRSNLLDKLKNFCTLLRKIHARNWMQWHAPTSGYPVTEPIASNRDNAHYT